MERAIAPRALDAPLRSDVARSDAALPVELAFRHHGPELLGHLRAIVRDEAAAEDLAQEAFLRLHAETIAGRPPVNVRAWLFRVAGNLATSRGRRLQVAARHAPRLQVIDGGQLPAEDLVVRREHDAQVIAALERLRPLDREVLLLAAAGLRGPEIARHLDRSEVATRTLICRARGRLRSALEDATDGGRPMGQSGTVGRRADQPSQPAMTTRPAPTTAQMG